MARSASRSRGFVASLGGTVTLRPLSLSGTGQVGVASSIGIVGATPGSVLTVTAGTLPDGLALNSAARTITGTPTVAGAEAITLTETKGGATGSPKANAVSVEVLAAANATSGVDYTFVKGDQNRIVPRSNAAAQTVTIPPGVFDVGTILTVMQTGAGALTMVAGDGVTLNVLASLTLVSAGQYAVIQALQTGPDIWTVFGALTAA